MRRNITSFNVAHQIAFPVIQALLLSLSSMITLQRTDFPVPRKLAERDDMFIDASSIKTMESFAKGTNGEASCLNLCKVLLLRGPCPHDLGTIPRSLNLGFQVSSKKLLQARRRACMSSCRATVESSWDLGVLQDYDISSNPRAHQHHLYIIMESSTWLLVDINKVNCI